MNQVTFTSKRMVVEYRGSWHELRVESFVGASFTHACYGYKDGAIPYVGNSQDEVIRKYLEDNWTLGVPIGSIKL